MWEGGNGECNGDRGKGGVRGEGGVEGDGHRIRTRQEGVTYWAMSAERCLYCVCLPCYLGFVRIVLNINMKNIHINLGGGGRGGAGGIL